MSLSKNITRSGTRVKLKLLKLYIRNCIYEKKGKKKKKKKMQNRNITISRSSIFFFLSESRICSIGELINLPIKKGIKSYPDR